MPTIFPQNVLRRDTNGKMHWMNRGSLLIGHGRNILYVVMNLAKILKGSGV